MTMPLCNRCKEAVLNTPMGQGHYISICYTCSMAAALDYIEQNRKSNMETIKSKRLLHSKIKEILETDPVIGMNFPQVLHYCEGMGYPKFSIAIEMSLDDHFIDEKGQKWVKA